MIVSCNKSPKFKNKTYVYEYNSIEKEKTVNSCPKYDINNQFILFYDCNGVIKNYSYDIKDNLLVLRSVLGDEELNLKIDRKYLVYEAEFDVVAMDPITVYFKEQ